jgi:hypothetical protein
MGEALELGFLTVKEIDEAGSVPELQAVNIGDLPILLLDGEELHGAKQNRVLNTSILLTARSVTSIPVSCTEHGRWRYTSKTFADSGVVMSPRIRKAKAHSVHYAYAATGMASSDQGEVWNEVASLAQDAQTTSGTSAMRDIFTQRESDIDEYLNKFHTEPGQKGLLVFVDSEVVGFDFVSRSEAFAKLSDKLIKSYAIDSIVSDGKHGAEVPSGAAEAFLKEAQIEPNIFPSISQGEDYRFTGKSIVGSALVVDDRVIHAAFFRTGSSAKTVRMSTARQRRGFRADGT